MKVKLIPIQRDDTKQIDWLYDFISSHHSLPKFMQPSKTNLRNPDFHYFKAIAVEPKKFESKLIGITCYEKRTLYLAETQKTIIEPEFRGQGWGKVLSNAIEEEVKKAGFHKIRSCIYTDNIAMIQIKLMQGYTIEGFHPDHDGPGYHEYSLGKVLGNKSGKDAKKKP